MNGFVAKLAIVAVIGVVPVLTGCTDQLKARDAQIALLEDSNQQLSNELAAARRESMELARQRDQLGEQAAAFRGQIDQLSAELANQPEPAPPLSEGWQAVPGGAMIAIEGSVLFAPGKQTLRDEGKRTLDSVVSTIRNQYYDKDVFVFGHTDDTPIRKSGWADNFELSCQRALSVVRHLQVRGISPSKLVACGAGEYRPLAPNSGDASRARNRRVEIFAVNPINR